MAGSLCSTYMLISFFILTTEGDFDGHKLLQESLKALNLYHSKERY